MATWRTLAVGWLLGLLTAAGGLALVPGLVAREGLTARLDAAAVARQLRPAIEAQVAATLPAILADLKRQTPSRVAEQLAALLTDARIHLYGVEIRLPPEALADLRRQIEAVVAAELTRSLDDVDVAAAARAWGAEGERLLREALRRHLDGRVFNLQLSSAHPWLALPVTLRVSGP